MATLIDQPHQSENYLLWGLGILMLAFLVSLPFMARDDAKIKAHQWQQQGCQMYDNDKATDIPAKCSQYFTDHYKAQQLRLQPPEANK